MPGTPIIYYGDEIGMGDNIYLGDRNSVRTPMQWTPDRNGGFSRADPAQLYLPVHYGSGIWLQRGQRRSANALAVIAAELDEAADRRTQVDQGFRPRHAEIHQAGQPRRAGLCAPARSGGYPMRRQHLSFSASRRARSWTAWKGRVPQEMLGRTHFPRIGELPYLVTLATLWFLLVLAQHRSEERAARKFLPRDITTLVLGHGWENALLGLDPRALSKQRCCRASWPERRWFADKDERRFRRKVSVAIPMEMPASRISSVVVDILGRSNVSRYFLPLTVALVTLSPR